MSGDDTDPVSRRRKIDALLHVARYDPRFTAGIVLLGIVAAILEGLGLGFILPIVELVQLDDPASQADGLLGAFVVAYETVGLPFTLGYVVLGVSGVMIARYTASFAVAWLREVVRTYYIRDLQVN